MEVDFGYMSEAIKDKEEQLKEILEKNDHLRNENQLFSAFVSRTGTGFSGSGAADGVAGSSGSDGMIDAGGEGIDTESAVGKMVKSMTAGGSAQLKKISPRGIAGVAGAQSDRKGDVAQHRKLTEAEKLEIASQEIEIVTTAIESLKTDGEKKLDDLRAMIEENELRITETKKNTYEFKRDIVIGAENSRTGKIMAEKMVRYMEDHVKAKDAVIEKLRLKNTTLRNQIQKMEQQLLQKEEMGEVLHVIDFDQLKIENQQYLEKIEERNNELLRLKLTTGRTVQHLNTLKKKLSNLTARGEWLQRQIVEKEEHLGKFADEEQRVADAKRVAANVNKGLREEQEDTEQPRVIDYIRLKAEVSELESKQLDWMRRLEIAGLEEKRARSSAQKSRTTAGLMT